MKKVVSCILAAFLLVAAAIPCFAAEAEPAVVSVLEEDLGNGVQCVTTVYMDSLQVRSNQCQGHVAKDYSFNGKVVATVVLTATFTYDGSTAKATGAYGSHSVASGWSYSGESTWCSGATARLTATVSGSGHSIPVSLSLTCSTSGTLS